MSTEEKIREIHKEIQQNIVKMLPEKFKKICLYASIIEGHKQTTGEMFFYYFPNGILKKNPINVYEIPEIFNIDEEQYSRLEKRLYESIKKLKDFYKSKDRKKWSNLTITISGVKYKVEFNYDNLINTQFNSMDRHIIWRYKYLELPRESFSKEEKMILNRYFNSAEYFNTETTVYEENVYEKQKVTIMDYNNNGYVRQEEKQEAIEKPKKEEVKKTKKEVMKKSKEEIVKKEKEEHIENRVKNQLLNF